jgi:ribose 5-phosphate isomerase RpiB
MKIAATNIDHIYRALSHNRLIVTLTREHNTIKVVSFRVKIIGIDFAPNLVRRFEKEIVKNIKILFQINTIG